MNYMDRVWAQIKVAARTIASDDASLSANRATAIVNEILRRETMETPPSEALRFLANELLALAHAETSGVLIEAER
jgi:hypothetical protein